jgi:predicted flavoprotein YhiN
MVATATGLEGSLVDAASSPLRDALARDGHAGFELDLLPDLSLERVHAEISHRAGARSLASHSRAGCAWTASKVRCCMSFCPRRFLVTWPHRQPAIKALPIRLAAARPLDEAISSAGGVRFEALSAHLMTRIRRAFFAPGRCWIGRRPLGVSRCTPVWRRGGVRGRGHGVFLARMGPAGRLQTAGWRMSFYVDTLKCQK